MGSGCPSSAALGLRLPGELTPRRGMGRGIERADPRGKRVLPPGKTDTEARNGAWCRAVRPSGAFGVVFSRRVFGIGDLAGSFGRETPSGGLPTDRRPVAVSIRYATGLIATLRGEMASKALRFALPRARSPTRAQLSGCEPFNCADVDTDPRSRHRGWHPAARDRRCAPDDRRPDTTPHSLPQCRSCPAPRASGPPTTKRP